jgi:O-antigen/teichoic acid export membrane protein
MRGPSAADRPDEGERIDGDPSGDSLGARTISAARWQTAASATKGVLQFGVMVLLARLLSPEEFGLAALALIVVGLAEMVVDLGLGPALVQREEITRRQIRVAFTSSALLGLAVTLVLVAAAPLSAVLLRNEAVPEVLRWQSLLFVFAGLGATARAVLERRLDFRGLFFVSFSSYVLGYAVVGVSLALLGFGVWSLVFAALAQGVIGSGVALFLARHPMRPLLAREELRDLLDFGLGVILNRLVVYASYNGDNFVIGRWLGSAALGLYSRAFQLMLFPLSHLQSITWNVLFSAYSRLQHDRERAAAAYLKGIQLTTLVVAPLMAGMLVAGPHLIVGLYGPQWAAAALPLQVLCAAGLLRAIYGMTGALTHAFGKVYAEFRRQALFAGLLVGASLLGSRWGITGVAIGVAVSVAFMYFAMAHLGRSIVGYGWRDFFGAQAPGVLVAGVVAGAAALVRVVLETYGWGSGIILVAIILASAAALPVGLLLLPSRMRPAELFQRLDPALQRLPARMRLPLRRMMRLTPEQVQAPL